MYLGVRKDIGDYNELRGKKIGVLSIGSCPTWFVCKMLIHHGLDPDHDVTLVPLQDDYPRIIEFMEDGRIDACLATEPNLSHWRRKECSGYLGGRPMKHPISRTSSGLSVSPIAI